ncbi:MAG: biliverdin-producing heme oxygenase [Prochlorococcus sp.]|jgi:heme oxygenase|nr:biliverdin-producing heme oxygenase [Prochlorococcus sp.]MDP6193848.1 biliverdin-producing heme oxygenase [Prochlorococcaceae cyanobacterium ETNP18_MAG_1]CAI8172714.1 MAG: Heme oxygenase [Prochlorococcus marinus str. MIT 9215]
MPASPPVPISGSISDHASRSDALQRKGFGPRVRKLHARIGKAHHQAEGMVFSKALLAGEVTPLQLAALFRAVAPAYQFLEQAAPSLAYRLGARSMPWPELARTAALELDLCNLSGLPATPDSVAATTWLEQLHELADHSPHRLMAHVYVRYGGDLSGGQQLGSQASAILEKNGWPAASFWLFERPIAELKASLHAAFEELELSDFQEQELLEEAEAAFHATQRLLAELALLH